MDYQKCSENFLKYIKEISTQKVAVIGHMRPDGDCIGSQIAMVRGLKALGINAVALNKDPVPNFLVPFAGDTPFIHEDFSKYKDYTTISVDCSDKMRMGDELEALFPKIQLNIDHHISNVGFGENNFIDAKAAATCEIIAKFFFNNKIPIDPITAEALYLGIATDTGQFRYSTTNAQIFSICAKLIELGAKPAETANQLYEQISIQQISLLKEFLGTLKLELDGKVCIGIITQKMFQSTGTTKEDTEGFVDYPRSIKTVEIAALIEERKDGKSKTSLRAKNEKFRVDLLAKKFNGGGHACAAGLSNEEPLNEFYPKFIKAIQEHFNDLGL